MNVLVIDKDRLSRHMLAKYLADYDFNTIQGKTSSQRLSRI